jgi:hypothetical protein
MSHRHRPLCDSVLPFLVPLLCGLPKKRLERCPGPATGLYGMAVGTERDHVAGMITALSSQVVDVIDFEDRCTTVRDVAWLARAGWVLARTAASDQDSGARVR